MASAEEGKHDAVQTGQDEKGCFNQNYKQTSIYSDSLQIWDIYSKDPCKSGNGS